ncbi:DUF418 domain-containing protein [Hymenobacter guriensis]|uniref:DUF418 domain-containing protein n=1 Tax=Hymenobacter guriensis TaxID=2793065 RepID=A0ABS0L8H3_9BACT|nr:DUF418 domain-containing protein [Hymenobacter guriensis]MBG8556430.1 DUF418 domain-containing protein [Hymenobacter guriensis]
MNAPVPASPPPASRRDDLLDILRGVGLVGVGAVNLVAFNYDSAYVAEYAGQFPQAGQQLGFTVFMIFLKGKFYPIMALVFGLAAALALEAKGPIPFVRRALVLGGLGLLQLAFIWNGDVLHQYALMSLLLLGIRRWPPTVRLSLAVTLFLVSFAPIGSAADASTQLPFATIRESLQHGSFAEVTRTRLGLSSFSFWSPEALVFQARIFGWLLLGHFLGEHARYRRWVQRWPALRLLGAALAALGGAGILLQVSGLRGEEPSTPALAALKLGLVALFYAGNVLVLVSAPLVWYTTVFGRRLLTWLAPLGRMSLTHYLFQNLLYSLLFYGYGLGLYASLPPLTLLAAYVPLILLQALVSGWWLRRFRQGPLEWLLLRLTRSSPATPD